MRTLNILLGGMLLSGAVMAQKPTADTPMSLEGQLGYNASSLSFQAPTIRFRYFLQDNIAVRLTVGVNNTKETENFYEGPGVTEGASGEFITKNNVWLAAIGGEYHFAGTDRLSPYAGLDIGFGSNKITGEGTNSDGSTYIADYSEEGELPQTLFGINLVAGTDYYFAENFYIGLEMGFLWLSRTDKEGELSVTSGGTTTTEAVRTETKVTTFSNNVIGNLRLGWRF